MGVLTVAERVKIKMKLTSDFLSELFCMRTAWSRVDCLMKTRSTEEKLRSRFVFSDIMHAAGCCYDGESWILKINLVLASKTKSFWASSGALQPLRPKSRKIQPGSNLIAKILCVWLLPTQRACSLVGDTHFRSSYVSCPCWSLTFSLRDYK